MTVALALFCLAGGYGLRGVLDARRARQRQSERNRVASIDHAYQRRWRSGR